MSKGQIHQVIGPVIDIKFREEEMPELLNAVTIEHEGRRIVTEVAQHLGDDVARCVARSSTDGLRRGMEATDTGNPIQISLIHICLFQPIANTVQADFIHHISRCIQVRSTSQISLNRFNDCHCLVVFFLLPE